MKKTRLLSLIASISTLTVAAPCIFTSCSSPNEPKSSTKEQFLKKYEEFLANYNSESTHSYTEAAFSSSDMFRNYLIDTISVEVNASDKSILKIYILDGGTHPYEMECAGMDVTDVKYILDCFEKNCKDFEPVVSYYVSDDEISMSIQVTEHPEYGEARIYKACELVINSKGYITKYVNIPEVEVLLGYQAILNLIYYPY